MSRKLMVYSSAYSHGDVTWPLKLVDHWEGHGLQKSHYKLKWGLNPYKYTYVCVGWSKLISASM